MCDAIFCFFNVNIFLITLLVPGLGFFYEHAQEKKYCATFIILLYHTAILIKKIIKVMKNTLKNIVSCAIYSHIIIKNNKRNKQSNKISKIKHAKVYNLNVNFASVVRNRS